MTDSFSINPIPYGLFEVLSHMGGGAARTPPLVSQLWGPKNSKTQIFQTDKVISFHLSS